MNKKGCEMKLCWVTTVGPKWQIVIPKGIRDQLNIEKWDSLAILLTQWKFIGLVRNEDISELMDYINTSH